LLKKRSNFSSHTLAVFIWTALAFVFLGLFFKIALTIQMVGSLQSFLLSVDEQILQYIGTTIRSPDWDFFFVDLSTLGSLAMVTTICVVSSVLFFLTRDAMAAFHLILIAVGGFQIGTWSKRLIERPRPNIIPKLVQVGGQSFPSGHAVTAAAIYLTLAILASRHFRNHGARVILFVLAATIIFVVAFSRLYLGVHYPSDVLSGVFLGSAWALLMGALFSRQHFFKNV